MGTISKIIESFKSFLLNIGELSGFASRFFKEVFKHPFEFKEFIR